jgi:hypothetical protein
VGCNAQLTHPIGLRSADLTEDIPYGLLVIKGIALLAGVETPYIDRQLYWCQDKMGMRNRAQ